MESHLHAFRLGDVAFVGVPGELFARLGLAIRRRSPFRHTHVLGLVNGEIGYIPDRAAYALGGYHAEHLKGKAIAIACPKLDDGQDVYVEKIRAWFEDAKINTLTVMIMEVPCCRGLSALARRALESATRKVPVKEVVVGIDGAIRQSEWLTA